MELSCASCAASCLEEPAKGQEPAKFTCRHHQVPLCGAGVAGDFWCTAHLSPPGAPAPEPPKDGKHKKKKKKGLIIT